LANPHAKPGESVRLGEACKAFDKEWSVGGKYGSKLGCQAAFQLDLDRVQQGRRIHIYHSLAVLTAASIAGTTMLLDA
jgi:hypothetical protein